MFCLYFLILFWCMMTVIQFSVLFQRSQEENFEKYSRTQKWCEKGENPLFLREKNWIVCGRIMQEIKRLKTAYSVFSICLLLFGTFILIYPNASIHIVYKVGGVIFIGFGITKMIGYFSKDIFQLAFQHDLAMGIDRIDHVVSDREYDTYSCCHH